MLMGNMEQVRDAYEIGQIVDYLPVEEPSVPMMPHLWFIRRTAPNREMKVVRRAHDLGLSCYLPTLRSRREIHRHRAGYNWIERKQIAAPLITGAILVPDFDVDSPKWKGVDGILSLLTFGDFVPMLTAKMFRDIRAIEAIGNTPKSKRQQYFEVGQLVRVISGPFRDFSASVERLDTGGRIAVGIEIFSRITPAILEQGEIEAV